MPITDQSGREDVLLVNMPFGALFRPAYDLSLLKAGLRSSGINARVIYFTIPFAEQTDLRPYARIANVEAAQDLIGDWIFSEALYGSGSCEYVAEVLLNREVPPSSSFIQQLKDIRSFIPSFIEDCVSEVLHDSPRIVTLGNSSRQQISSLALAKQLKTLRQDVFVVFVGKNCEGIMGAELLRRFPDVDAVISGEPDVAYPELVQRVLNGQSCSGIKGVYTRDNIDSIFEAGLFPSAVPVTNLDSLPYPDFDDFFLQHQKSKLDQGLKKQIYFETSRGCWWGERSHCTFCGLSEEAMPYRSKSADRALEEIASLTSKYPSCDVFFVDSILNWKYFKDVFPRLAQQKLGINLFYETKANLKKRHVRLLREAGVTMIQAGVESFNSDVLKLMGKGVGALQNIQLLKSCKEYGVKPYWNLLWGFPGESSEDYREMAKLIPLLTHLPKPQGAGKFRLERFSPNFEHANELGIRNVRPSPAYFHVYPFPPEAVRNLAYYFSFDYQEPRDVDEYASPVLQQILKWMNIHEMSDLFYVDKGDRLLIWDLRPGTGKPLVVLTGLQRQLFLACDDVATATQLKEIVQQNSGKAGAIQEVEDLMRPILHKGLLLKEKDSYLNLAIPLGGYSPTGPALERFYHLVEALQRKTAADPDQHYLNMEVV